MTSKLYVSFKVFESINDFEYVYTRQCLKDLIDSFSVAIIEKWQVFMKYYDYLNLKWIWKRDN